MRHDKIWFDASTILQFRRQSPVGLSRMEAHVLAGALSLDPDRAGFCRLNRYTGFVESLARSEVEGLLRSYGESGGEAHGAQKPRKNPVLHLLREIERRLRTGTRRTVGQVRRRLRLNSRLVRFSPGDILVFSGATWNMIDAPALEKTLSRDGAHLVALLADMIPWRFPHHFQEADVVGSFLSFAELLARRASLVLSISQNTDRDLGEFAAELGIDPGRREVIYLGADPPAQYARQPAGLPRDLLSRGYVLSVSTIQVRKNHQLLYLLWRRFAEEGNKAVPRLVLAGLPGWLTGDLLVQIRTDPLVHDSIIVLHQVDDAELSWLYGNAKFTLYPSFYEGWGLPIVESLQHGKPCLASNTSSMPEAGQGLAAHLDPLDFTAWRREILRRVEDPAVPARESERIRARFRPRSWQDFSTDFAARILALADSIKNEAIRPAGKP